LTGIVVVAVEQAVAAPLATRHLADLGARVISVADIAAGMYASSGILGALFQRERTGIGQTVEVSMLEALGEWMGYPYFYSRYGGADPPRAGASHATIAPYGPVATATGEVAPTRNHAGCPQSASTPGKYWNGSNRPATPMPEHTSSQHWSAMAAGPVERMRPSRSCGRTLLLLAC
jgi:hypothetical protein